MRPNPLIANLNVTRLSPWFVWLTNHGLARYHLEIILFMYRLFIQVGVLPPQQQRQR
jgi:hypothetical protein